MTLETAHEFTEKRCPNCGGPLAGANHQTACIINATAELDALRAKVARVEALDFRMRRLGAASDDSEVAGWNHALNVAQDDLRAALVGAADSSCDECDDLAEHEAAVRHAAGDPRWEAPQEHREPSGYFGGGGGFPRYLPLHRTEAGYPNCSTCDGGGCLDCTDPA